MAKELTSRQQQIMNLASSGEATTVDEIALKLDGISTSTVANLLTDAYARLGIPKKFAGKKMLLATVIYRKQDHES